MGCAADCGGDDPAPITRSVSFADGQVSPDQARIADALPALLDPTTRILHVGVGCSDLALRFAPRVARIDGITIMPDERDVAEALGLPNYRVFTMDKHARAFAALPGPYDLLIDNNPGSFACCVKHFDYTMRRYRDLLAPGGRVLTEARGAAWRQAGGISLRWRHWVAEGRKLGLTAEHVDGTVWALRKDLG